MTISSTKNFFSPLSNDEFISKHLLKNEPYLTHFDKGPLEELFTYLPIQSLENLLQTWPSYVNVYGDKVADEVDSFQTSAQEAGQFFENGRGLYFDDINQISPMIDQWKNSLQNDLKLSPLSYGRSLVYAIPEGKGTDAHFDQNINIVLQISGTKTWSIAPNETVDSPLERYTIGTNDEGQFSYAKGPFPTSLPKNAKEYQLSPGSILFVPRGSWHQTKSLTNSLSLNFTFSPASWIDVYTDQLRKSLSSDHQWRETALFLDNQNDKINLLDQKLREQTSAFSFRKNH